MKINSRHYKSSGLKGVKITQALSPKFAGGVSFTLNALQQCVEASRGRYCLGVLGPQTDPQLQIDLNKVSHKISNLRMSGDWLIGDVKVLSTPMGKVLSQLLTDKVEVKYCLHTVVNADGWVYAVGTGLPLVDSFDLVSIYCMS